MTLLFKNENNILPRIKIIITDKLFKIVISRGLFYLESDNINNSFVLYFKKYHIELGNNES